MKTDPATRLKAAQAYAAHRRAIDALLKELDARLNAHVDHLFPDDGVRGGHVWELGRVRVRLHDVVDLLPPIRKER